MVYLYGVPDYYQNKQCNDETESDYEVEKILGETKIDNKTLFKIRWTGYSEDDDTYEPIENLN